MYKDILVSVDGSDVGIRRLRFAMQVAKLQRADLAAYYTSPTTTDGGDAAEEVAETVATEFEKELQEHGLNGRWVLSGKPIETEVVSLIRCCDLAILGLGDPDRILPNHQGFSIGEIVLSCGRPILGVPIGALPEKFVSTAIVAWDGSREAARAMHDAIPLLLQASSVKVVSIAGQKDGSTLAEPAAAHLTKHGIKAEIDTSWRHFDDVGSELFDRTDALEADLIVAGAYGHSRVSERLFGGTSRTLLHQMLVPVLVSH
jgi:nucleotide-binding universal stress UspA family protein